MYLGGILHQKLSPLHSHFPGAISDFCFCAAIKISFNVYLTSRNCFSPTLEKASLYPFLPLFSVSSRSFLHLNLGHVDLCFLACFPFHCPFIGYSSLSIALRSLSMHIRYTASTLSTTDPLLISPRALISFLLIPYMKLAFSLPELSMLPESSSVLPLTDWSPM